jgi:hypothetical protein
MYRFLMVGCILLLVGCGEGVTLAPSTAVPRSSLMTLMAVDLMPLLAQDPGQLVGFTFDPPTKQVPLLYREFNIPSADATLTYHFKNQRPVEGFATISLYSDQIVQGMARSRLIQSFDPVAQPRDDLGEDAWWATKELDQRGQRSIVFERCAALVMLTVYKSSSEDIDAAVAYAKVIDQRIQHSSICAQN